MTSQSGIRSSTPSTRDATAGAPSRGSRPGGAGDAAECRPAARLARLALSIAWIAAAGHAEAAAHRYTPAERYAGCLFGETIPLMRRGTERERALSVASDRCIAWSEGLSESDIREVDLQLHRAIERSERSGL